MLASVYCVDQCRRAHKDVIMVGPWMLWGTDEVWADVTTVGAWMLWETDEVWVDLLLVGAMGKPVQSAHDYSTLSARTLFKSLWPLIVASTTNPKLYPSSPKPAAPRSPSHEVPPKARTRNLKHTSRVGGFSQ